MDWHNCYIPWHKSSVSKSSFHTKKYEPKFRFEVSFLSVFATIHKVLPFFFLVQLGVSKFCDVSYKHVVPIRTLNNMGFQVFFFEYIGFQDTLVVLTPQAKGTSFSTQNLYCTNNQPTGMWTNSTNVKHRTHPSLDGGPMLQCRRKDQGEASK